VGGATSAFVGGTVAGSVFESANDRSIVVVVTKVDIILAKRHGSAAADTQRDMLMLEPCE
jgi:hypothetical protein